MSNQRFFMVLWTSIVYVCLQILPISGVPQIHNYNISVKTAGSPIFDSHEGKLKINLLYKTETGTSQEDFDLTPNAVNIEPNHIYDSIVASFASLANISSIYLRWTLASPYNPIYSIKKPSIYFDYITLTSINSDTSMYITTISTGKFCSPTSPVAIQHKDGTNFYPCV